MNTKTPTNAGSPSGVATGSALCYADGSPVKTGDVAKINNATCTVIRIINDRSENPWMVACRIEGCGRIEHGVFAARFRKHHPQNAIGMAAGAAVPPLKSDCGAYDC